jgi:hypothetical protein
MIWTHFTIQPLLDNGRPSAPPERFYAPNLAHAFGLARQRWPFDTTWKVL